MKNENMINKLHEADMLYFVLGSLISADSLIDVEACHKALDCLENLRRDFETSKLKEDQKLKSLLEPDGSDVPLHILIDMLRRRRFIITHRVKHIQHSTMFPCFVVIVIFVGGLIIFAGGEKQRYVQTACQVKHLCLQTIVLCQTFHIDKEMMSGEEPCYHRMALQQTFERHQPHPLQEHLGIVWFSPV